MRKVIALLAAGFLAVLLTSCDLCPYHSHEQVEISDEGFSVSTIDSLGSLLRLEDAAWSADEGIFVISVDYGLVAHDSIVSVHVDGREIGTMGTAITFSMEDTETGRDFTFTGMPEGRHIRGGGEHQAHYHYREKRIGVSRRAEIPFTTRRGQAGNRHCERPGMDKRGRGNHAH